MLEKGVGHGAEDRAGDPLQRSIVCDPSINTSGSTIVTSACS